MDKLDKAAVRLLAKESRQALEAVAERHGLTVTVGGGRYDPTVGEFRPKVTFALEGAEEREFAQLAPLFGLAPNDIDRPLFWGGKRYILKALKPRSPRFPVIAEGVGGKRFKFPEDILGQLKK